MTDESEPCNLQELVAPGERKHADEIEFIAKKIKVDGDASRVVLIGGPSSAGKTTFAKRLTTHLNRNGVGTLVVSTDNYFVGDAKNPKDENGNPDYEHIRAMDLDRLNENIVDLVSGRKTLLPRFDFQRHAPAPQGREERLERGSVIIIEGLHCLNPELTPSVPMNEKFLILADTVSSPFNIVAGARKGDGRLIRRIIRDSKYRARGAGDTIEIWPSVRAGEKRWIRPFEDNAEFVFDTTLAYEPAVLKRYVRPLLATIPPGAPPYDKAQQLLSLLACFIECGEEGVPGDSILREYIGGGSIEY